MNEPNLDALREEPNESADSKSSLPVVLSASAHTSGAVGRARSAEELAAQAARFLGVGREGADNTRRAYAGDWSQFSEWCGLHNTEPLPANAATLVLYVTDLAGLERRVSTIQRKVAAISKAHRLSQHPSPTADPTFKEVMEGIRRVVGRRTKQAPAFKIGPFKRAMAGIDQSTPAGVRDRALLLLGLAGAFRREELASLNIEHLNFGEEALVISLERSKTNQRGEAQDKAIFYSADRHTCPVRSTQAWLQLLARHGHVSGPLFVSFLRGMQPSKRRLSAGTINALVKQYLGKEFTAHSLRASFVTIAKLNGADDAEVMNQTGHKTAAMIRHYTRVDTVIEQNAGKKLGL